MIQLTLNLKMTTAQVVETSVTVNDNSPIQDYVNPDDQSQPTFKKLYVSVLGSLQCTYREKPPGTNVSKPLKCYVETLDVHNSQLPAYFTS